ncbi:MAG: hypothetical protein ROZ00_10055 [Denitratisoma sp.]|nr:hypothetical protein [Denitratisoma sp.]
MTYVLRKAVLDIVPEVEITPEEFVTLKAAREILTDAFAIEEKYEIVVSNFLSVEKQLLDIAVTNAVRDTLSYGELFEIRSALNIRIVNLLTATKLYFDQLPQHIADCVPDRVDIADTVKRRCSEEYDKFFEYRFMEALRNHVQHRGIPIHFIRQDGHWTSFDELGQMEFSVFIAAQRDVLESDGKFKKTVLSEMTQDVNLLAAARRYVESLSSIHQFVRDLISDSVTAARARIESAHTRYSMVFDGSLIGLSALDVGEAGVRSSFPLLLEWDDVRIQLQKRNRQLVNLAKRYVTSKVPNL